MSGDGSQAVKKVSTSTLAYYEGIRKLSLEAERSDLKAQPITSLILIGRCRLELAAKRLTTMTGKELFEFGINAFWTDPKATAAQELGEISVSGDTAVATVESSQPSPTAYDFVREKDGWKIDLTKILSSMNSLFEQDARSQGVSPEEYVLPLLEKVVGHPIEKSPFAKPPEN